MRAIIWKNNDKLFVIRKKSLSSRNDIILVHTITLSDRWRTSDLKEYPLAIDQFETEYEKYFKLIHDIMIFNDSKNRIQIN